MAKHSLKIQAVLLCAAVAVALVFVGCAPAGPTPEEQAAQANRAYMSQVNEIMEKLGGNLDAFTDAVSRDDLVGMNIQMGNAKRTIDALAALVPPEVFKDVHAKYTEGVQQLRAALEEYVALYTDIQNEPDADYSERLASVQASYDAGIASLQAADDALAAK